MNSILINPQYCAEDKDIIDFVRSMPISMHSLIKHLRDRGVYVSKDATKEDLANLIAKETFIWEDVTELLSLVTEPLKKESHIIGNHFSKANMELIEEAASSVKTLRLNKYGDEINLEPLENGDYLLRIDYIDTFYEKTRLIQRVERDAEIRIQKTPYGFKTIRSDDDVAKRVEASLLGEFERLAQESSNELETKRILLKQLTGTAAKVDFFRNLMEGIIGFDFQQIKSVRVQSEKDQDTIKDSEEGDELAAEYAAAIESLVINGRNIGKTNLYDQYIGKEFYPISSTWIISSDTDECQKAEVKAAFTATAQEAELSYSVAAIWRRGSEASAREKPSKILAARFSTLLSDSADKALEIVLSEQNSSP